MIVCVALAVTIERVAYKPLRDAPASPPHHAIGVSFFLEFFGALSFVFSPRFIPYQRPFDVVTWYAKDGIHLVTSAQAPPVGSITSRTSFLIIVLASVPHPGAAPVPGAADEDRKAMRAASFDKPAAR